MSDSTYRDADSEAATLGRKRKRLARWWRPLIGIFAGGTITFTALLCGDGLGLISLESIYPWGLMAIVSAICIMGPAVPLLIMIPLDVCWDRQMRRAFQRRRLFAGATSQKPAK